MPPKRECQTESPLCTGDAECTSTHRATEPPPTSLAAAESGPLLLHTTHLPWNQQEHTTPQSMAPSLVLAGKSYQVWKPGVLLRGGKKRNLSATRKKQHMRMQSHHSVRHHMGKSGGTDSIQLAWTMGQRRSWSEERTISLLLHLAMRRNFQNLELLVPKLRCQSHLSTESAFHIPSNFGATPICRDQVCSLLQKNPSKLGAFLPTETRCVFASHHFRYLQRPGTYPIPTSWSLLGGITLTYRDEMCIIFQCHISEQISLCRIQVFPFFLGEVHDNILKGHWFLEHQMFYCLDLGNKKN